MRTQQPQRPQPTQLCHIQHPHTNTIHGHTHTQLCHTYTALSHTTHTQHDVTTLYCTGLARGSLPWSRALKAWQASKIHGGVFLFFFSV
jgi:hypothetical protein